MHAVCREIVIPPLFTVRNNRRACGFKSLNRVSSRFFIETIEFGILAVAPPSNRIFRTFGAADGEACLFLTHYDIGGVNGHAQARKAVSHSI